MRNPLPHVLRRKTRWFHQADAYVDGRVTPVERDLFEERLEESPELQEHVHETRQLKQMLSGLPEHPAPRSFALNPGMLAERERRKAPLAPRVALQLAQATAVVSIAALVFVGLFDVSSNMNGGAGGNDDAAVPASGDIESANGGNGSGGGADGAAPLGTTEPPGDADGANGPEAFGDDAIDDGAEGSADEDALPEDDRSSGESGASGTEPAGDANAQDASPDLQSRSEQPETGSGSALLYGGLVSLTVLAAGVWIYAKRWLAAYS